MAYQHQNNPVEHSSQEIDNESYNDTYKIRETGSYGYQSSTDSFIPLQMDAAGGVKTSPSVSNIISSGNSTTTLLTANQTFTGTWEDVSPYATITVTGLVDQNSAANGAQLQFSNDGSTVLRTAFSTIVASGFGFPLVIPVEARYFRIVYTNGTTNQGTFILQSIYHLGTVGSVQLPLGASVSTNDLAGLNRAVLAGVNGTSIDNVNLSASNNLQIAIAEDQVGMNLNPLSSIVIGQDSITGTASQLGFSGSYKSVTIKALAENTQNVYIGTTSSVTTANGFELAAGDSIDLDLQNGQAIWAIAVSGTQTICRVAIN